MAVQCFWFFFQGYFARLPDTVLPLPFLKILFYIFYSPFALFFLFFFFFLLGFLLESGPLLSCTSFSFIQFTHTAHYSFSWFPFEYISEGICVECSWDMEWDWGSFWLSIGQTGQVIWTDIHWWVFPGSRRNLPRFSSKILILLACTVCKCLHWKKWRHHWRSPGPSAYCPSCNSVKPAMGMPCLLFGKASSRILPYEFCEAIFIMGGSLQQHIGGSAVLSKKEPHVCSVCGKGVLYHRDLQWQHEYAQQHESSQVSPLLRLLGP